jgi:hypothetical protein
MIDSWRATAAAAAWRLRSYKAVEPRTSVNRKVTVPSGKPDIVRQR